MNAHGEPRLVRKIALRPAFGGGRGVVDLRDFVFIQQAAGGAGQRHHRGNQERKYLSLHFSLLPENSVAP